jgi:hypothetical protein
MDLIDLYNAGLPAAVENAFGDTLRLEQLTPDYLRLNTGKGSLQLVLLRMVNDSQLYCLIRTACGPVCDSRISFYSPSWNRLPAETFLAPEPPVFSTEENVPLPASVETFTEWGYDPASAVLRQTGQSTEALPPEEGQGPRMLTEVREYRWTGMRFE